MDEQKNTTYETPPNGTASAQAEPAAAPSEASGAADAQSAQNPNANGGSQGAYTQNPNGYTAQNAPSGSAQNPYTHNPYANRAQQSYGQNPYAQNQNPYGNGQNPYGQYNAGYGQYPYGQPTYRAPQTPYYGQYYAGGGFVPLNTPDFQKKREDTSRLRRMSMAHGLSVLGFSLFAFVLSFLLLLIPGFKSVYQENTSAYIAVNAVFSLVIIFVPFLLSYVYQKKRNFIKDLPLGTPYDGKAAVLLIFAGLMCCIAGSYATNILSAMVEGMFGITFTMPQDETVLDTVPKILLTVLGTAVVPAFVEEFAIRGTVMQPLRRYGDKFAIAMSALVFAMMHGNMVQIPFAFIAGIAIGYAVTVTGSMWVGVAIHFLNNFTAVMMQVAVDNLAESAANLVILSMVGAIGVVGLVCAVLYFKMYARVPMGGGEGVLQRGEKGKTYICTVPMILAFLYLLIETAQYVEF